MLVPQLGDQKNTKNHLQTDTVQVTLDNISIKLRIKTERRQTQKVSGALTPMTQQCQLKTLVPHFTKLINTVLVS